MTVEVAGPFGPFTAALARHPVTGLEEVRLTLEELFLHYYGEGK